MSNTPDDKRSFNPTEQLAESVLESAGAHIAGLFLGETPLAEVEAWFEVAGVETPWTVREARVTEALNEPYAAVVEALCQGELQVREVPGRDARLALRRDMLTRLVPGVVSRVDDLGTVDQRRLFRFTVVSRLWLLALRKDCRIFQDKNVPEIVREVLSDAGVYDASSRQSWSRVERKYMVREYCVQYQETDLAFVARLLEEEGIGCSFEFDERGEKIVFFDGLSGAPETPVMDGKPVAIRGAESRTASVESIRHFDWTDRMQPTAVILRDYDFTRPDAVELMTVTRPTGAAIDRAVYDYPGRFTLLDGGRDSFGNHGHAYTLHDGARRAETRAEELEAAQQRGRGVGNVSNFAPGFKFTIAGHGRGDLDEREFVLVRVEHRFRASEATRTEEGDGEPPHDERDRTAEGYQNTFECVRLEAAWRPPRVTSRPLVYGTQTAKVMTPEGEDIHVDTHGRIKVRFHWDHADGAPDERRSCWIRVAQVWAGAHWGFVFIPRKGMEVVVNFLEGNPDRPLVVGCVYNGTHPTQYPLPEQKTRSYIRTQSTPGDDPSRFNELRFEDQAGHEEVWIHAQRDLHETVRNNHGTTVGAHQTNAVKKNQTETVGGNQTLAVGGNRVKTVTGDEDVTIEQMRWVVVGRYDSLRVEGNQQVMINGADGADIQAATYYQVRADLQLSLNTGTTNDEPQVRLVPERIKLQQGATIYTQDAGNVTIEAPESITLKVGGTQVILRPGGMGLIVDDGASTMTLVPERLSVQSAQVTVSSSGAGLVLADDAVLTGNTVKLNP